MVDKILGQSRISNPFVYYDQQTIQNSVTTTPIPVGNTDLTSYNYIPSGISLSDLLSNSSGYQDDIMFQKLLANPAYNFNLTSGISNGTYYSPSVSATYHSAPTKIKRNAKDYGPEFLNRVKEIANKINCDYQDLLAVMNSESGINAQSQYVNPKTGQKGAVGLIQFTQIAIDQLNKDYGTHYTKESILAMSPVEQLDVVEKYLMSAKSGKFASGARLSAGDLYALVYLPNKAGNNVLARKGDKNYAQNAGLDVNKDGVITTGDLAMQVDKKRVSDSSFTSVA